MRLFLRIMIAVFGTAFITTTALILFVLFQGEKELAHDIQTKSEAVFYFIAVLPEYQNDAYYNTVVKTLSDKSVNYKALVQVFTYKKSQGVSELITLLNMCRALEPDGLIVSVEDSVLIKKEIDDFENNNIPVVTLERDISSSKRHSYIGSNAFYSGYQAGLFLNSKMSGKTNVAIVANDANTGSTKGVNTFVMGFGKAIKNNKDIRFSLLEGFETNVLSSEETMRNILVNHSNINLVIFPGAKEAEGAAQTIVDFNLVGSVYILCFDESVGVKKFLDQGIILATIFRNPERAALLCMDTLVAIHKETSVSANIETEIDIITQNGIWHEK